MTLDEIKTAVEIANSLVATLVIVAGAGWFLFRRSLAGTLQIALTLTEVTRVNNIPTAIIRVTARNVGQTRIQVEYCSLATRMVYVFAGEQPIEPLRAGGFDYAREGVYIFQSLVALEPNEETWEDVALALTGPSVFAVGVQFTRKAPQVSLKRQSETWDAMAMFHVRDASMTPSTRDKST